MPLETGSYIGDLVTTNPASSDTVGAGDDHLRLIKSTLKATFPFVGGPAWRQRVVAASTTITASTENMTHFITTDNLNLNLPDGATAGNGWVGVIYPFAAGTTVHLVPAGVDSVNGVTATASVQYGTIGLLFGTGGAWYLHKVPRYADNALFVPGGATISGTVVMTTGPLIVQGPATISALAVTAGMRNDGATTLSGSVQMLTTLNVQGATTLSGVTACVGKLTCAGGIDATHSTFQSATVLGTVTISGTTVVGGNLFVAGPGGITVSAGVLCANLEIVGAAVGSASYIDFKNNLVDDFDARIVLTGDDTLDVQGLSSSGFLKDGEVIYHESNILGTVSQSGGTPTGAVIEQGSNANGYYVRFADGTQICTAQWPVGGAGTTTASVFGPATYPAGFSSAPRIVATNDSSNNTNNAVVINVGTATFEFWVTVALDSVNFIAIGRWF